MTPRSGASTTRPCGAGTAAVAAVGCRRPSTGPIWPPRSTTTEARASEPSGPLLTLGGARALPRVSRPRPGRRAESGPPLRALWYLRLSLGRGPKMKQPDPYKSQIYQRNRAIVLSRSGFRCQICGGYADTADHVLPLAKGGTHHLSNLRAACRSCNSRLAARQTNEGRGRRRLGAQSRGW
jgi:hypothetical protein